MLRGLRSLFARQEDPYWGLDVRLSTRIAGLFTITAAFYSFLLWPLSPPNEAVGDIGFLISIVLIELGAVAGILMLARPSLWTWRRLALTAFGGVGAVSVGQWLAGGAGAPYETMLLIPTLFVAAVYPPRVIAAFLLVCAASLAAPLVYDQSSGDLAANALGPFLLLVGVSAVVHYLLLQIRTQRVALAQDEKVARAEARLDELTSIGNRRAFEEALNDEISRADRMGTPLTMAMGDIEHFKYVNDEFGHLEGDYVLHNVAHAIHSELRAPDRVFRWGGDEFVLLLPGADTDGARSVIERMQAKVTAACRRPDNEPIRIFFASAQFEPGMKARDLCSAADLALMAERSRESRQRA